MRSSAVAVLFALVAPVLAAQQATVKAAAAPSDLDAELHYPTGQNAWIATNKPAYVALFDVSRSAVTQIYPAFSAQAEYPTGSQRRAIDVPYANLFGGSSSLIGLHAATLQDGGWPHMLLLVASTSPLRVGSPWMTEISLNHDLIRQHHVDDLQTDGGIEALVDLVKPLDPDAEMAYDRLDGFRSATAQFASSVIPATLPLHASIRADSAVKVDATSAVSQSRAITDPVAIERFIDGYRSSHPLEGAHGWQSGFNATSSTFTFDHGGSQSRGAAIGPAMGPAISAPTGPAVTAPASSGARISKP